MANIEVLFRRDNHAAIVDALFRHGCVLLREFTSRERAAALRADLAPFYDDTQRAVFTHELLQSGKPGFVEHLLDDRHKALLDRIFAVGDYAPLDMHSRRVGPPSQRFAGHETPLNWHIDAVFTRLEFGINFWTPLTPCGSDAPGLAVVPAPFQEVIDYVGYDGVARVNDGPPDFLFESFQPPVTLSARGNVNASEQISAHFAPRIWRPHFAVGDAMLLTTWTLHATHATSTMTRPRDNVELRLYGSASLADILAAHAGSLQALGT